MLALMFLGSAAAFGCASTSQGNAGQANLGGFRRELGTAAMADVERQVPRLLNRYQYQIDRQDASEWLLTIQTRWNSRLPFQDEVARGALEARTRLTITARSRYRTGGPGDLRVVELLAENLVLVNDSTAWNSGFMTPMFAAYLDEIADQLETDLRAGIRVP